MTDSKDRYIEDLEKENARLRKALAGAGRVGDVYNVVRSGGTVTISKEYYIELLEDKLSLMRAVHNNEDLFMMPESPCEDGGES